MTSVIDSFRLAGEVAMVTGASFGLGRAMAEGLAEAGADIVGISRHETNLGDVERAVHTSGRRFLALACDVGDRRQLAEAVAEAHSWQGRLDILVNNAGIIERAPAVEHSDEAWDSVMRVNLDAVWFGSREAGKFMVAEGKGKIITTASILTFSGGILVPGYAASKGAIAQLTKALANEWAPRGVSVNAIAPGYFVTRNTEALRADEHRSRAILERIPADRWGDPDDLKGAAVFLASSASDYVHGHVLVVDGGWFAR